VMDYGLYWADFNAGGGMADAATSRTVLLVDGTHDGHRGSAV
jgi:hypothetical protein